MFVASDFEDLRMHYTITIQIFPRNAKQWLRVGFYITAFALIAHFSIVGLKSHLNIPSEMPWEIALFSSFLYTAIIIVMQLFTAEMANRLLPLRSKGAAAGHIFIQSLSVVASFLLARQLEILITGFCSIPQSIMTLIIIVSFVLFIIGNTVYYLFAMYHQLRAAEQAVLQSELKALRAQINPHFLFNALNSIAALIRTRPDEAEHVTEELADLFRYSLRASKTPLVRLEEEVESARLCLSIEKARFRDRLNVSITIPPTLLDAAVPSLLLQPLVENAIKHGANVVEGDFFIELHAEIHNGDMVITVFDSGVGFDPAASDSYFANGTGLSNVRARLLLLFPGMSNLLLERRGIRLIFPYQRVEKPALHVAHTNEV